MSNILDRANKIVNERSEEKERMYGSFDECHQKAAEIASILCKKEITKEDTMWILVALKLARESFSHKEDNLLDAVAYIAGVNDMLERSIVKKSVKK